MNKYEILENIGQGEYGVVLKARNKETGQLVAIKKFKEDDSDEQNKRVILRQVKILKTLSHQNIIQLKQAFRKKCRIYLVCEYVDKNLLQLMEKGTISSQQLKNYVYQMLKGIAYMNSLNIIHRDIKPENILISKSDKVKICDLGFARNFSSNGKMTDYVATRWYRPPELILGRDDYDKSIDVWAIACVMAEMIDGQPLFGGENDLDQLYLIQKCLGPLTAQHQQCFLKNPKFIGMKFPQIHTLESIERRYFGKIDKFGIDLLKKMLKMEPTARISAQQALNHPFFNKSNSFSESQFKKNLFSHQNNHSQIQEIVQLNLKSNLPVNNFLHQNITTRPSKQEKISTNKVTGLGKMKKTTKQSTQNNHQQSPRHYNQDFNGMTSSGGATKGKSLGKKGAVTSIRQKNKTFKATKNNFNQAKNQVKRQDKFEIEDNFKQQQQYYQQSWQKQEPEKTCNNANKYQESKQKKSLLGIAQMHSLGGNQNPLGNGDLSNPWNLGNNIFQGVQGRSKSKQKMISNRGYINRQPADSPTKQEYQKIKRNLKNMKRDNISIVFNNNTYNVNVLDQGQN